MEKKRTKVAASLLALAGLLAFTLFATAGSLEPPAAPGPTMKTLDEVEPRVAIHASDLPLTITEPNSYYLVEDVNFTDDANHAITVECNDVTIDLMGYTVKGPDSGTKSGIYMNWCANVEVRDGTVRDFGGDGIYETGYGKSHRVINVRAISNMGHGICIGGAGHLVKDCTSDGNGDRGIYTGFGCIVTGNTARYNGTYGIFAVYGCTVTGNTTYNNFHSGIHAQDGCTVTGNTTYDNFDNGIYADVGCTVTGNTANGNTDGGIKVGSYCTVVDNACYNNGNIGDGAGIHAGSDNRIEQNNVTDSNRGIDVDSSGNVIADNMVKDNTDNYDIAAGNQLNILLCEVPETIEWPATVTLAGSLTSTSTTEHAITVDSNDVTIDLSGHSLIGPDSGTKSGIYMHGRTNVEVRNGTVRDFYYGIYEDTLNGKQHRVVNVRAVNNVTGIALPGNGHIVKDCTAFDNSNGGISAGYGCTFIGNAAYNNKNIGIRSYDGSTLTGNTAYSNTNYGIYVDDYCLIDQNTTYGNGTNMAYGTGCQVGLNVAP